MHTSEMYTQTQLISCVHAFVGCYQATKVYMPATGGVWMIIGYRLMVKRGHRYASHAHQSRSCNKCVHVLYMGM